jgi:hypothetical protein
LADDRTYTADQVATAARELRQAAGADEQRFSTQQVVSMLSDEVRMLRERGFTDERIADLLSGFDIELTTPELARFMEQSDTDHRR